MDLSAQLFDARLQTLLFVCQREHLPCFLDLLKQTFAEFFHQFLQSAIFPFNPSLFLRFTGFFLFELGIFCLELGIFRFELLNDFLLTHGSHFTGSGQEGGALYSYLSILAPTVRSSSSSRGQNCLCRLRYAILLVGETTPGEDEDQHREHDDDESQEQEYSCRRNHWEPVRQGYRRPIGRGVQERDDDDAALCLVETPRPSDTYSC